MVISQLPNGVLVDLMDDSQSGFQRVAISVWVPIDAIELGNGGERGSIVDGALGKTVRVGTNPDDTLNSSSALREIASGAQGLDVRVLDSSRNDFVQVRIEGWILQKSVEVE